jgi:hypothetical protein
MRLLPKANTLRDAVQEVIKSNIKDQYRPNRFINVVSVSDAELKEVCERLICKTESLPALFEAFQKHRDLLTLEDFVSHYGETWGFNEEVIKKARLRAEQFDQWVNHKRYEPNHDPITF